MMQMQKNNGKGFVSRSGTRKTPSPVVRENNTRNNRNSPVRVTSRIPTNLAHGPRPRSGGKRRTQPAENDHAEFLSQCHVDGDALSLQGPELDTMKDFVQNQIQQDMQADQAKGRKSPSTNRGASALKGSFGGSVGKTIHVASYNKEPELSDHHSDTTEVERYMNSFSTENSDATDAIMKLASQMDKADIDKTISVLMHLRQVIDTPNNNYTPRRSNVEQQNQQNMRRSNSGPPGIFPNRQLHHLSSTAESDIEEGEEEVRHHNDHLNYSFIPPAGQKHNQPIRAESEISFNTVNSGSRTSTPAHKRSPTPISHHGSEHCPVVERYYSNHVTIVTEQCPANSVSHITKTEFSRPPRSRETSSSSLRNNNDDLVSVGSSNSSFTQVTVNSAGNFSYPGKSPRA